MCFNDILADAQSDPEPCCLSSEKRLEESPSMFRRDSVPGIAYRDFDESAGNFYTSNSQLSIVLGGTDYRLDAVPNEV